jgi:hypothetical protein
MKLRKAEMELREAEAEAEREATQLDLMRDIDQGESKAFDTVETTVQMKKSQPKWSSITDKMEVDENYTSPSPGIKKAEVDSQDLLMDVGA